VFGISGFELLIIVVFVLIIFGPDKMPELARTFGKAMRMFKRAQEDMESVIRAEVYTDKPGIDAADKQQDSGPVKPAAADSIWAADEDDADEEEPEGGE
jgi:TatA/E family protein of Tat protein translocase